jgi:hypothetical protein
MQNANSKKSYERPELRVLGTLEKLTQSVGAGTKLDAVFPAGTSLDELTFS